MNVSNNKPDLHASEKVKMYRKCENALLTQMTKKRDGWNRLLRQKAKMIEDTDKQVEQLKKDYNNLERKVEEKRELQRYYNGMVHASTPTNLDVPTSPPTQNNPRSLEQRNVVTPIIINNPYAKHVDTNATKPPPAPVQPTGGNSAIFDAAKHDEEAKLNAPQTKVQEKQQEKHEDDAQNLNEIFDNEENEEEMVLATMNSSEKAEYMWENYGRDAENDDEYFTGGHSTGKEWENEEAELEAYNEAQKAKAEHDRKTAFACQDPTKSTVAAEVKTAGTKRQRKPSLKAKEMEEAASEGVVIKKEKLELQALV